MDSLYNKALNKSFSNDVEIIEHKHQKSLNKESESQNYFFYDNESHREKEALKEKWNAIDVSKKQTLNDYIQLLIKQRKNENLH